MQVKKIVPGTTFFAYIVILVIIDKHIAIK